MRVAPPEAPVTGYMFGKGVYFADMFSKSANYCYATRTAKAGVLLLCEVVLYPVENIIVIGKDILLGWNTVISPSVYNNGLHFIIGEMYTLHYEHMGLAGQLFKYLPFSVHSSGMHLVSG